MNHIGIYTYAYKLSRGDSTIITRLENHRSQSLVLKVWSLDQLHQHIWELVRNKHLWAPPPTC